MILGAPFFWEGTAIVVAPPASETVPGWLMVSWIWEGAPRSTGWVVQAPNAGNWITQQADP